MTKIVARMMKLKAENLKGIEIHNQRETDQHSNKDIDVEKSHLNYDLVNSSPISYKKTVQDYIKTKRTSKRAVRKDAVLVDEWILTSSPDFFQNLSDSRPFFETCLAYFEDRCGKENIQYGVVHLDESTPHMHLGIVPMTNGRLNHKMMFDRQALIAIQDELPQFLREQGFSIERGVKGSERKHLTVPEYKELQEELQSFEQAITQTDKLLAEKNKEFNKTFSTVRSLEAKQEEIVQSLKSTPIPKLENKKSFKIPGMGLKYVLSDSEFSTLKTTAETLEALRTQNNGLKFENKMLHESNTVLEQDNERKSDQIVDLTSQVTRNECELKQFRQREEDLEESDSLRSRLEIHKTLLDDEKKINAYLKSDLDKLKQENNSLKLTIMDLKLKYESLKLDFVGLKTYLHDCVGNTASEISQAIKQGVTRFKNAPKIYKALEFYSLDKRYYVSKNGDIFSPEKQSGGGLTVYLNTEFKPIKPPMLNKKTGYYEFEGEYIHHGHTRINTLYLSEEELIENTPFSFERSSDSDFWGKSKKQSYGYSQDKGWSR